jgi:hypothetical protein
MSIVSSVVLCASASDRPMIERDLFSWMSRHDLEPLMFVQDMAAGIKAMEQCVGIGAYNGLDEAMLADKILSLPWDGPERMTLLIQPDEGPTAVHHLRSPRSMLFLQQWGRDDRFVATAAGRETNRIWQVIKTERGKTTVEDEGPLPKMRDRLKSLRSSMPQSPGVGGRRVYSLRRKPDMTGFKS